VSGAERLFGHYESRQSLREMGVGIVLGTLIAVLIGIAISSGGFLAHELDIGIGALVAAASVGVVGGATGIALATLDDIATLDVL
jgi:Mg/Co/Ni transporter MgtE